MASPGPRPLPKNVRELRGSKRPPTAADEAGEVDLPVEVPDPPDELTESERAVWTRTGKTLAGMRVISAADRDALVLYCRSWVEAEDAHAKILETDYIVKSPKGYPIINPWVSIRRKAEERCLKILEQFGMTPAARVRVSKT